eukprot:scaffold6805_cov59-Isochrysis_galbana.AAC.1
MCGGGGGACGGAAAAAPSTTPRRAGACGGCPPGGTVPSAPSGTIGPSPIPTNCNASSDLNSHRCLSVFWPPNLGLSRQYLHTPQSSTRRTAAAAAMAAAATPSIAATPAPCASVDSRNFRGRLFATSRVHDWFPERLAGAWDAGTPSTPGLARLMAVSARVDVGRDEVFETHRAAES